MAWPIGDLISVVYEVYARENSIRGAARVLNIGIGTVQNILAEPDRPRQAATLETIQAFYEKAAPTREDGPYGSSQWKSTYWLQSHFEDIAPARGADAFLINYQGTPYPNSPNGWRSSGWKLFNDISVEQFMQERGLDVSNLGDIRFGRGTS